MCEISKTKHCLHVSVMGSSTVLTFLTRRIAPIVQKASCTAVSAGYAFQERNDAMERLTVRMAVMRTIVVSILIIMSIYVNLQRGIFMDIPLFHCKHVQNAHRMVKNHA